MVAGVVSLKMHSSSRNQDLFAVHLLIYYARVLGSLGRPFYSQDSDTFFELTVNDKIW